MLLSYCTETKTTTLVVVQDLMDPYFDIDIVFIMNACVFILFLHLEALRMRFLFLWALSCAANAKTAAHNLVH